MWADTETITLSEQGYSDAETVSSTVGTVVTLTYTDGGTTTAYYNKGTGVRVYAGGKMTITANGNTISEVVVTFSPQNSANISFSSNGTNNSASTNSPATWEGSATSVDFNVTNKGHARIQKVQVTYTTSGGVISPSISANNVEIPYDATSCEIGYNIVNPISGTNLNAATEADWITGLNVTADKVTFTTTANTGEVRTATITLTYSTTTKEVTVTQASNPNAPGTENNPYTVAQARAAINAGTGVNNVYATGIVSAIPYSYSSSNGITFNMVDNSGDTDFLQAYKCKGTDAANVQVGDVVVVKGNLKKYNSIYEFDQNCTLVSLTHQPSILATPTQLAVPNYKYGTAEPTYKTLTVSGTSLKADITLSLGESSNFEISADKENWSNTLTLSQSNGSVADKEVAVRLKAGLAEGSYEGTITLTSTDATNVTVNLTGSVTSSTTTDNIFGKYTSAITEGYYVITYDDHAMKNTFDNKSRFENGDFEATNNIITNPDPSVIWYIEPNGDYWTIYNDAKAKYAAGTNTKNEGALIDDITDFAKWTVTVNDGTFQFENLGRSNASEKWLRNNGSNGWACYNGNIGGALTLYKQTTLIERVIIFDGNGGSYNEATTHTQNVYDGVEATLDANPFTREGYVFAGWNTVSNGENGTAYTDQATISVVGDNLTLYAQWSPLYALTIDENIVGGSVAVKDNITSAIEGTEITLSFTQTSGHAFGEWDVYKYGDESTKVTVSDNKFTMPAYNVVISASFREVQTYSLVTNVNQIVSGKHYIIASGTDGSVLAMGQQNDNNRAGVAVNASNGIIPETEGVYEFAIYGPDANGYYSIYDETSGKEGYLYAASNSSNYLKTQNAYNSDGRWEFTINTDGVATIIAKGNNGRNWMRYNDSNSGGFFSCYGSNSKLQDIYLFEKDNEATPTVNVTFASSGYASYCSPLALNLTPSEDYAAYAVTATSGTTVTFTKITGAVLPKTPFILYGKSLSGETISLPIANGETTDVEDNMLRGTLTPTAITTVEGDYTNFGLSGGEFKKIASGTIPANKAYLPVLTSSLSSEARLTIVLNDGTTGVNDVRGNVKEISDSIFDLQGRKVSKPTKGLYIMNGKKVFVK